MESPSTFDFTYFVCGQQRLRDFIAGGALHSTGTPNTPSPSWTKSYLAEHQPRHVSVTQPIHSTESGTFYPLTTEFVAYQQEVTVVGTVTPQLLSSGQASPAKSNHTQLDRGTEPTERCSVVGLDLPVSESKPPNEPLSEPALAESVPEPSHSEQVFHSTVSSNVESPGLSNGASSLKLANLKSLKEVEVTDQVDFLEPLGSNTAYDPLESFETAVPPLPNQTTQRSMQFAQSVLSSLQDKRTIETDFDVGLKCVEQSTETPIVQFSPVCEQNLTEIPIYCKSAPAMACPRSMPSTCPKRTPQVCHRLDKQCDDAPEATSCSISTSEKSTTVTDPQPVQQLCTSGFEGNRGENINIEVTNTCASISSLSPSIQQMNQPSEIGKGKTTISTSCGTGYICRRTPGYNSGNTVQQTCPKVVSKVQQPKDLQIEMRGGSTIRPGSTVYVKAASLLCLFPTKEPRRFFGVVKYVTPDRKYKIGTTRGVIGQLLEESEVELCTTRRFDLESVPHKTITIKEASLDSFVLKGKASN